jgi:hypothetical protein
MALEPSGEPGSQFGSGPIERKTFVESTVIYILYVLNTVVCMYMHLWNHHRQEWSSYWVLSGIIRQSMRTLCCPSTRTEVAFGGDNGFASC